MHVQGDYGAKVDALLRRLLWLKDKEPDIKSLVRLWSILHMFDALNPCQWLAEAHWRI